MTILQNKINFFLARQGFTPAIQRIIKVNAYIISIILCIVCVSFTQTNWFLWFFCGAILTFFNFFFLALFIQKTINSNKLNVKQPRSFLLRQLFLSNLRLFITGILLYTLLVILKADPFALVLGLTLPLAMIPILLLTKEKIPF